MGKGKLEKFADMRDYPHVFEYPYSVVDNVPSHGYDAPNPGSVRIVFDVDVKAGRKETLKVRLVPVVE